MIIIKSELWLWRVWNQGWPDGHEDSTNEWGAWSVITHEEALRLAANDALKRYQFVRFEPVTPS